MQPLSQIEGTFVDVDGRYVIVVGRFNHHVVDSLVEGAVETYEVADKVVADIADGDLRDLRHQHLLDHARHRARQEAAEDHQPDPPDRIRIAADEDVVEHRLHHVAEQAEHGALDAHEGKRDEQQPAVLPEVVPPQPAEQMAGVFRAPAHARSSGGRLASNPA